MQDEDNQQQEEKHDEPQHTEPQPLERSQPLDRPQAQQASQPQHLPGQAPTPDYPVRVHSRRRAQVDAADGSANVSANVPAQQEDIYAVQHPDVIESRIAAQPQQQPQFQPQPQAQQHQQDEVFELQPFQETAEDREQAYIQEQEARLAGLPEPNEPEAPPVKACRHEYVRIFQRKLKDLNRRMVCTKAYLPVGFKMGDFSHLGENSFCFCATCRVRLYPKRSQAEKAEARIQLAQGKALKAELAQAQLTADLLEEVGAKAFKELLMHVDDDEDNEPEESDDENVPKVDIHVEELEQEAVGVEDIDVESLKGSQEDDNCEMLDQEEM